MTPARAGRALAAAALGLGAPGAALCQVTAPAKAQACVVCHGPLGLAQAPDTPHLAGQPAIYLRQQLQAFRSGERRHERMSIVAKELSDDDIEALARWFESIEITARLPK